MNTSNEKKPVNKALYVGLFALIVLPIVAYSQGIMDQMTAYLNRYPTNQTTYQLQILYPKSGDVFNTDEQMFIQWKNPTSSIPPSEIFLLPENTQQFGVNEIPIASNAQSESYLWKIPANLSGRFDIRVQNSTGSGQMHGFITINAL